MKEPSEVTTGNKKLDKKQANEQHGVKCPKDEEQISEKLDFFYKKSSDSICQKKNLLWQQHTFH